MIGDKYVSGPDQTALPIPHLHSRLSYADNLLLSNKWLKPAQVIKNLLTIMYPDDEFGFESDIYNSMDRWFYRLIIKFNIPNKTIIVNGEGQTVYPGYVLALMVEELTWRNTVSMLPTKLSIEQLANALGRPLLWVQEHIDSLGIQRALGDYRKTDLNLLREINIAITDQQNWVSVDEIIQNYPDLTPEVFLEITQNNGLICETRRSTETGKCGEYWHPSILSYLSPHDTFTPRPGGDWYTPELIAQELAVPASWVKQIISDHEIPYEARLDDNSRLTLHVSPHSKHYIKDILVRDAHKIEGCALIDIKEIKAYTGLTTDNIILILNDMGIKAKIGPSGQKLYHPYALEIIDAALRVIGDNDDTESVLLRIFTEGRRTAQIIAIRNLLVVKGANYYTSKNLARRAIIDRLGGLCSNRLGVF